MHEVGIMMGALDAALNRTQQMGGNRIHLLKLRIGELSGVSPDALEFAFEVVTEGTIAEGARLEIENAPAVYRCAHCGDELERRSEWPRCRACPDAEVTVAGGQELDLVSMEIT